MVKFWTNEHTYPASWEEVTTAFWMKYSTGHPLTRHVMCSDVISRELDSETHQLRSTRILQKTNNKPKWGEMITPATNAYIVEHTIVDPIAKTMSTFTRNINYNRLMTIEESCTYSVSPTNPQQTICATEVRVVSNVWGWANTVEKFGIDRFKNNANKAREALSTVIQLVRDEKNVLKQAAVDKREAFKAAATAIFDHRPQSSS